jgi:hypothetical protein
MPRLFNREHHWIQHLDALASNPCEKLGLTVDVVVAPNVEKCQFVLILIHEQHDPDLERHANSPEAVELPSQAMEFQSRILRVLLEVFERLSEGGLELGIPPEELSSGSDEGVSAAEAPHLVHCLIARFVEDVGCVRRSHPTLSHIGEGLRQSGRCSLVREISVVFLGEHHAHSPIPFDDVDRPSRKSLFQGDEPTPLDILRGNNVGFSTHFGIPFGISLAPRWVPFRDRGFGDLGTLFRLHGMGSITTVGAASGP